MDLTTNCIITIIITSITTSQIPSLTGFLIWSCIIFTALPDKWYQFGSSAFKYFEDTKTWEEAKAVCSANKGSLIRFDSEHEKQFVYQLIEGAIRCV